jgi:hypothetical protein
MNSYERAHIRDIAIRNQKIGKTVDDAMKDLAKRYTTVKGKRFASIMNERLEQLHDQILNNGKDGIKNQWMLANKMNNKNIDGYLASIKVSDALQKSFRSPNLSALNAFLDRTEKGMNLSDRVWNFTEGVKGQMEGLISRGVLEGKSAIALSKELKQYINGKPIRYEGTLIPGKNLNYQAIRLAATEMNMAYRTSDYLQNSRLPFVTGVTINLSGAHPVEDICDELAGEYPKGFQFVGWHPMCICYATYDTLDKEEFVQYIKSGEIEQSRFTTAIPDKAQTYIDKNGERLLGYENTPYWLRDNFTKDLELRDVVRVDGVKKPIKMAS